MTGCGQEAWQLTRSSAVTYERFQVPSVFAPLARTLLHHADLRPGERVLDVACGTGIVARLAAEEVGVWHGPGSASGADSRGCVVGVDLNPNMLEIARRKTEMASDRLQWRQGDATALPLADCSFDVALCQQGLQFFGSRDRALGEMRRVLRPGGRLGICVWRSIRHSPCNAACLSALVPLLGKTLAGRLRAPFALGDPNKLRRLIDRAGFESIEIHRASITRRMLPPEVSIPGHLASTPLGPAFAALSARDRATAMKQVADRLSAYRDHAGLAVPQGTLIALARKPVEGPG